jgi:hypothetical protein
MAETAILVTTVSRSGSPISFVPSDTVNGNSFTNDGHTWAILNNLQGTVPCTVTIKVPHVLDGDLPVASRVIDLAIGEVKVAGPFDQSIFNQTDGRVILETSQIIGLCFTSTT